MSDWICKAILHEKRKKKQPHSYFEKLNLPALKQNRFITQWGLISCWVLLNILALKIHVELETMKCTKGDHRAGKEKKSHNCWRCKCQEQSMLVNYGLINITSAHSLFGVIVLKLWFSGLPGSSSTTGIKKKAGWPFQCLHWKNTGVWMLTLKWGYLKA